MRSVLDLTARYLADPAAAGLNPRQCVKLERRLVRAEEILGWSRADAVEYALATAMLRLHHARPTLYINNIGSSGSHWLNGMLRQAVGLLGEGEIYVPTAFLRTAVAGQPPAHRPAFLQAVYLAHLMTGRADDVENHVCNTAHLLDSAPYTENDIASLRILLIRDPVEIALSRTLRKPEYRAWLGMAEVKDAAYLADNVRIVNRFFKTARLEDYHLICRYEDLVDDPVRVLQRIFALLQAAPEPATLRAIADRARRKGAPGEERSASKGALHADGVEALRQTAARALAGVRGKLGYA